MEERKEEDGEEDEEEEDKEKEEDEDVWSVPSLGKISADAAGERIIGS